MRLDLPTTKAYTMETQDLRQKQPLWQKITAWAMIPARGCSAGGGASGQSGTAPHTIQMTTGNPFNVVKIEKWENGAWTVIGIEEVTVTEIPNSEMMYGMVMYELEATRGDLAWDSMNPIHYRVTPGTCFPQLPPTERYTWFPEHSGTAYADGTATTLDLGVQ
jgi:hypothetical protein